MDKLAGDLMPVPDVAKKLGVKPSTVYAWIHSGLLPGIKIGRCVRVRPEKLAKLIDEREKKTYGQAA